MTLRTSPALRMTATERAHGRFMRGPEGHDNTGPDNDDDGLDNDDEDEENEDQSGDAEDDDSNDDDQDANDRDEGNSDDEEKAKAKPNGWQRRIDKLTRELAEERAKSRPEQDSAASGRAAKPDSKPVVADFDTYEDFVEALTDWKTDQRFAKEETARNQRKADDDFNAAIKAGKKAYPDWNKVVTEDVEITPHMIAAIKSCDNPADIAYYLGSKPEEADRIADLSPAKQAVAIAKIDAKFDGKKDGKPNLRAVSNAPEPIRPNKSSGGRGAKDQESMSADEFIRSRNAELRAKKG